MSHLEPILPVLVPARRMAVQLLKYMAEGGEDPSVLDASSSRVAFVARAGPVELLAGIALGQLTAETVRKAVGLLPAEKLKEVAASPRPQKELLALVQQVNPSHYWDARQPKRQRSPRVRLASA